MTTANEGVVGRPDTGPEDMAGDWQATFDVIGDGISILDADLTTLRANRTLARWFHSPPEALIGRPCCELMHGTARFPGDCPACRAVRSGQEEHAESDLPLLGGTFRCSAYPLSHNGAVRRVVHILRDVTEHNHLVTDLRRQTECLGVLHETALSLATRRDLQPLLEVIVQRAAALLAVAHGFLYLLAAGAVGQEMELAVGLGTYAGQVGRRLKQDQGLAGQVWGRDRSLVAVDDEAVGGADAGSRLFQVAVPLRAGHSVVGVLGLASDSRPAGFRFEEIAILSRFAELASIAVDNAWLYRQAESEIAERRAAEQALEQRAVQLALLNEAVQRELSERRLAEESLARQEAMLRSVFRAASIGIGIVTDRVVGWTNEALQRMVGRSGAELLGQSARILYESDAEFERVGRVKYAQIAEHGAGAVETRFVHKSGRLIDVYLSSAPLDPADLGVGVVFTAMDITERRWAEAIVRSNEAMFRLMFEQAPIGMAVTDLEGRYLRVNEALCKTLGYTAEELLARRFVETGPPDEVALNLELRASAERGEIPGFQMERRFCTKSGEMVHGLLQVSLVRDAEGRPLHFLAQVVDITARKLAEEALRHSEARYRGFVEQSYEGIWEIDREGATTFCNERLLRILGYQAVDQMLGRKLHTFFARVPAGPILPLGSGVPATGSGVQDCVLRRADGANVYVTVSALPYRDAAGQFAGATLFLTDITDCKQVESALRQSEARYRTLFESAGDAILIHDLQGRFLAANRLACERLGYTLDELLRRTPADVEAPVHGARLADRIEALQLYGQHFFETVHLRSDGTAVSTELSSRLIEYDGQWAVLSIARDITERKQIQQLLLRTERLAAMGQLAAALAHEINNPLQSIGSSMELVLDYPLDEAERQEYLEAVRHEIRRLMDLTGRVLDFARPPRLERQPMSMADVAHYAVALAGKQLEHSHIRVHLDLPDGLPRVQASHDELVQVCLNLIINAIEAMPHGGDLCISACFHDGQVALQFADSGPGLGEDALRTLFQPFHTTKADGTGLGLAVSYSIIQGQGGTLNGSNAPGGGAVFTISLPCLAPGE